MSNISRKVVWTLSVFLVLIFVSHENAAIVDAFTTKSNLCRPVSSNVGRTIRWSSSEASVVEEDSSAELASGEESSEKEALKASSNSVIEANANGDKNEDPDIDSMMNESSDDESEEENLMQQIKDSGVAGVISYAAWELAFWTVSVPVCVLGYKEVTGHWPDINDKDDISKLGAEAFAFVNFARFAVPLRIGLALGTTPWIQENIVDVFLVDKEDNEDEDETVVEVIEEESLDDAETDEDSDEEKNVQNQGGRFRIRSRLRNLKNRVFKPKNQVEQEDKE